MATCPRCGGFLDEHHRCRGPWRFYIRTLTVAVLGALIGSLAVLVFNEQPATAFIIVMALLGAVLLTTAWLATF